MSPREPIPARTPSRLRSRPRRCALSAPASVPRRLVACSDVDGTAHVARWARGPGGSVEMPLPSPAWSGALGEPTPLAVLLAVQVNAWDLDAEEREAARMASLELIERARVAREHVVALPPPFYTTRPALPEPPPLRQVDVAGDLAAALREIPDRRSRAARAGKGAER